MVSEHAVGVETMPASGNKKVPIEERLASFEARHGFPGVMSPAGRMIYRRCACGKGTPSMLQTECVNCEKASGKWEGGKRKRDYENRGVATRDEARTPKVRERVVTHARNECRTKGCSNVAKRRGTLCERCYVEADPETRACPTCKKSARCTVHDWGVCQGCVRSIDRAAARLWRVSGGQMSLACSALVRHGMTANSAHDAKQLMEALEMGALASEDNGIDANVFGECL